MWWWGERKKAPLTRVSELMKREPTVMGIISMDTGSHMMVHLVERNHGTAPHPLNWNIQRISLDTYSANLMI